MVIVSLAELLNAYEFASSGTPYENAAYVSAKTGAVYVTSSEVELEEEVPEDLETSAEYLAVPTKNELDLGRILAVRFAEQEVPELCGEVASIFGRKGAYGRFKQLLESHRVLQRWFEFEAAETEAALRRWCGENHFQAGERGAPGVA